MKWLIFLLFIVGVGYSSPIDTRLFEGPEQENYYSEIKKQIETAIEKSERSKETIQEEQLYLEKVRSAFSKTIQIEASYIKPLENNTAISLDQYYSALTDTLALRFTIKASRKMLEEIHSKSIFSKKLIDDMVEDKKSKLLSYQLQYAYYKLQKKNIEAKLSLLQAHEQETIKMLLHSLSFVKCDAEETIDKKLQAIEADIEKILQQKVALQIDLEKEQIEESAKIEQLNHKMLPANAKYQEALNTKIMLLSKKSLCALKERKNKDFFVFLENIKAVIGNITKEEQAAKLEEVDILHDIAKDVFGTTKLFFGATLHESMDILTKLKDSFSSTLFVFNEQPISILSLFKVLGLIILGFMFGMLYKRWIASISRRWPDMSQMSVRLASNIGYYLIVIITLIIAVGSIGIDMTSISLIAGALSIGIGFGLQTVVSNLIAGIILMFERTIRIGDTIEISDVLKGRVTDMRIRSTTIKTFDNLDIVVPNSSFIQSNVINWTLDDLSRRLHVPFSVAYGTDVQELIKIVLAELEECDLKYIRYDKNKQPEIWMIDMNNSSVDFELLVWIEWDHKLRPNSFKSDFLIFIYNTLYKHHIEIPFPQLDLHVKQIPSETLK